VLNVISDQAEMPTHYRTNEII